MKLNARTDDTVIVLLGSILNSIKTCLVNKSLLAAAVKNPKILL